ncbi:MAG: pantoate--beta-alanine ligase, partial [Bacillus sp. (in: Bacteria)]|nr:pantoate--beta-alanine ligase [Bacillus sp. (in: firmicutes)]
IEGLIADFHYPIEVVAIDIVREPDGLAKSSRNVYLSPEERQKATILSKSLLSANQAITEGERNPVILMSQIREMITELSGEIDYVEIFSYPQLKPLEKVAGTIIIALAVKFTKVRLIDNLIITIE